MERDKIITRFTDANHEQSYGVGNQNRECTYNYHYQQPINAEALKVVMTVRGRSMMVLPCLRDTDINEV